MAAGVIGKACHCLAGHRLGLLRAAGLQQCLRAAHIPRRVVGNGLAHLLPPLARFPPVLEPHRDLGALEVPLRVLGKAYHRLFGEGLGLLRPPGLQQRLGAAHIPRRVVGKGLWRSASQCAQATSQSPRCIAASAR